MKIQKKKERWRILFQHRGVLKVVGKEKRKSKKRDRSKRL